MIIIPSRIDIIANPDPAELAFCLLAHFQHKRRWWQRYAREDQRYLFIDAPNRMNIVTRSHAVWLSPVWALRIQIEALKNGVYYENAD